MTIKSVAVVVLMLALSTSIHADIVTHGRLTTDDATDYITDSSTGRIYKRFGSVNLNYEDTISAVSAGGIYEEWSIATSDIADDFYSAALGVETTPCTGASAYMSNCGTISGWVDGDFGANINGGKDSFWYLSTYDTPNRVEYPIALAYFKNDGVILDVDDWYTTDELDKYFDYSLNALLYQDTAIVPVPAAVWLFSSGLIGLIGVARRKARE